jgi:hypothetical protein
MLENVKVNGEIGGRRHILRSVVYQTLVLHNDLPVYSVTLTVQNQQLPKSLDRSPDLDRQ